MQTIHANFSIICIDVLRSRYSRYYMAQILAWYYILRDLKNYSQRVYSMKRRMLRGIGEYDHYVRYFQISGLKITWPVSRTVLTSKNYRQSKQAAKPLLTSGLCSRHDSSIRESIQPFLAYLAIFVYPVHSSIYAIVYFVPKKTTMNKRRNLLIFHAAQFGIQIFLHSDFRFILHPERLILLFLLYYTILYSSLMKKIKHGI